jgi:hypothetical protein
MGHNLTFSKCGMSLSWPHVAFSEGGSACLCLSFSHTSAPALLLNNSWFNRDRVEDDRVTEGICANLRLILTIHHAGLRQPYAVPIGNHRDGGQVHPPQ